MYLENTLNSVEGTLAMMKILGWARYSAPDDKAGIIWIMGIPHSREW